jgi:uncharacterized membrane protein
MRTLFLIRIALLVFVVCWVNYSYYAEKDLNEEEQTLPKEQVIVRKIFSKTNRPAISESRTVSSYYRRLVKDY